MLISKSGFQLTLLFASLLFVPWSLRAQNETPQPKLIGSPIVIVVDQAKGTGDKVLYLVNNSSGRHS